MSCRSCPAVGPSTSQPLMTTGPSAPSMVPHEGHFVDTTALHAVIKQEQESSGEEDAKPAAKRRRRTRNAKQQELNRLAQQRYRYEARCSGNGRLELQVGCVECKANHYCVLEVCKGSSVYWMDVKGLATLSRELLLSMVIVGICMHHACKERYCIWCRGGLINKQYCCYVW